ncbi:hypothetical protein [Dubosiella newyorkensis]|uniref:hypothetical protein n=2 Tax=Dubosiella TaxID=1937008 RepID=UPI002592BF86|nr:hypothetical protein [Dubosiella newyorkensis]
MKIKERKVVIEVVSVLDPEEKVSEEDYLQACNGGYTQKQLWEMLDESDIDPDFNPNEEDPGEEHEDYKLDEDGNVVEIIERKVLFPKFFYDGDYSEIMDYIVENLDENE